MPNAVAGGVLDAEFLFLLSLLRPLYAELPSEFRGQARAWLQRLCWVPVYGDGARSDRNEYLCRLYMGMQKEKLEGVFLEDPPEGPLLPPAEVFPTVDPKAWLDTVVENGGDGAVDERTYLATHTLPNGRGAFGYLAVSMAKGDPHFVPPRQTPESTTARWSFGEPQASSTPRSNWQTTPKLRDILCSRPPPEQRRRLLDLYDSLLSDVEQAEKHPDIPCPELDNLITSCQGLSLDGDTSEQRKQLLSQLRARLRSRRDRVSRRADVLDSLQHRSEEAGEDGEAAALAAAQEDEDSVRSIRPENVALLEAAYPQDLVDRFLDAIVRERIGALGRVQARRYCQNHVNGVEEDAAEDMEHYRDAMSSWAGLLREKAEGDSELARAAEATRGEAERCQELAGQAAELMRQLDAARRSRFRVEEELRTEQERLRADMELLRAERAAQRRHS